jgi:hypothetical protein
MQSRRTIATYDSVGDQRGEAVSELRRHRTAMRPLAPVSFGVGDGSLTDGGTIKVSLCIVRFAAGLKVSAVSRLKRIPRTLCGVSVCGGKPCRPVAFGCIAPDKR